MHEVHGARRPSCTPPPPWGGCLAPTEEEEALAAGAAAAAAGAGEGLGLFDCLGPGPPRNLGEEDLAPFAAGGVASRAAVAGGSRLGAGVRLGELAGGVATLAWG